MRKMVSLVMASVLVAAAVGSARAVPPRPSYSLTDGENDVGKLRRRFEPTQLALLEKLNRADVEHLARQKKIVVPDRFDFDELDYGPFPLDYLQAREHAKLLLVDQEQQAFAAYENGRLVRWGPVSTGRKTTPTPPGSYHLNWRSRGRHSTVDTSWFMRWYFNFDNRRGLSLHEYALPGQPESHRCVRLLARDAQWLYDWGEEWQLDAGGQAVEVGGTPLVIRGEYRFGAPKPWLDVDSLAAPLALPEDLPPPRRRATTEAGPTR